MNTPVHPPAASLHAPRAIPSAFRNRFLLLSVLSALTTVSAHAASNLAWDPGHTFGGTTSAPTGSGTAGTWTNGSGADWSTSTADTTWTNANGDNAFFNGTGAIVTLGSDITVNNINVSVTGYTLAKDASNAFTLTVNGTITNSQSATITAKLGGSSGLTKAGNGTLILFGTAANTYTGATTVQSGILQARAAGSLTAGTTVTIGSASLNATATLDVRASQTIAGIATAGTGTSTITQLNTTGTTTLTINPTGAGGGAADSTFSGTITEGGSGKILAFTKAGSNTLTLTGTNSYSGATSITGGTLQLGSNLANTVSVTVSGTGTLSSNVANVNLGVGSVSMSAGTTLSAGGTGAAGSFTLAASQNFSTTTGGTLNFDVGTAFDQIIGSGTGTFSIGSGTTLALTLGTGFSYGNTYTLFSSFAGGTVASSGFTISGYDTTNYTASLANTGILSFAPTAVPEPSTYATILGAVALGFVAYRRRR